MPAAVDELVSQLSLEEKVSLLAGRDLWCTPPVERLEIPALKMSDGPNGVRGGDMSGSVSAACFPVATALAATWNTALVREVGRALGQEARSKRAHLLLAPTANLHRSPLAGRNFECFSEDPHLSARMAVAFVAGVQDEGVGCAIKHFVCNDSEFERHTISSEVDERALREIYLAPFEAAVKEARPWAVMAAYNRLNGTYCGEHADLLTRVLREEWGFEGFVVSDWFGTRSTGAALAAGLDLEMPGPSQWRGPQLLEAVKQGEVEVGHVDTAVRRVLAAVLAGAKTGIDAGEGELAEDRPEHRMVARRAAAESVVLLRNERGLLPLEPAKLRRLALIGPLAAAPSIHGGGSSRVAPHYEVAPLQAIAARCGDGVEVVHEPGCAIHKQLPALDGRSVRCDGEPGLRLDFFRGASFAGDPVLVRRVRRLDLTWLGAFSEAVDPDDFSLRASGTFTASRAGVHRFGLTSAGLSRLCLDGKLLVDNWSHQERGEAFFGVGSTEVSAEAELDAGQRVEVEIEFAKEGPIPLAGLHAGVLPPLGEEAFASAVEAARGADVAVVMVGLDADWETEGRDREDMELPGRQNELVERVAAANPNTVVVLNCGSPVATPWLERVPSALCLWYPGQECGSALADVLFGDVDPSGRLPQTWPMRLEQNPAHPFYPGRDGQVHYGESIYVGYRYYEAACAAPRFPFGHGLSYTSFAYSELVVEPEIARGQPVDVSIDVTNTGDRAGQEVVQLYVRDVASSCVRPEKELRGFTKLHLEPGETRTAHFTLGERDLAFWLPEVKGFVAEPGDFELLVGRSSQDIRARARFDYD